MLFFSFLLFSFLVSCFIHPNFLLVLYKNTDHKYISITLPKTASTWLSFFLNFLLPQFHRSKFLDSRAVTVTFSQPHCYFRRLTLPHILFIVAIVKSNFAVSVTVVFSVFVDPPLYRCTLCLVTHLPIKRLASA